MTPSLRRPAVWVGYVAVLAVSVGLTACGSGSSSSDATTKSATTSSAPQANLTAAKAAIAPYVGKPSPFPVDVPLKKRLPQGTTLSYLQCAVPVCGLFAQIYPGAAKLIGAKLTVVKASPSAQSLQSSLQTITEKKPSAVLFPAIEPAVVENELAALNTDKIPVSSVGVMQGEKYGIDAQMFGVPTAKLVGGLLADWVVARHGDKTNAVFYATPELSFSKFTQDSFSAEMERVCPACDVRYSTIPVTTIGNTAPARVVSELQRHPKTNIAIFGTAEAATGLPAALKPAGIKIDTLGWGPTPANLQDIKSGGMTAGLALDFPVMAFTQVDAAARLVLGQDLTSGEKKTVPPIQFLEQKDITFDPSKGWTGYPDFAQRFARFWKAGT
jgi:ribose transport system substrate-binding protein